MGCMSSKKYVSRSSSFQDEEKCVPLLSRKSHTVNLGLKEPTPNANFRATDVASSEFLEFVAEKGRISLKISDKEHGSSEELEALKIPTAIEFGTVGSLREWLHEHGGGEVSCLTPKFGSFSSEMKNERGCFFSPELVAAIEEHMQQLELDEEAILKKIADNWQARSS